MKPVIDGRPVDVPVCDDIRLSAVGSQALVAALRRRQSEDTTRGDRGPEFSNHI